MGKSYKVLLSLLALSIFLTLCVSAEVTNLNIVTANNTEFNTATPTISANITGNCSAFYANFTLNGVIVKSDQVVNNATNTNIVATTSTNAGNYLYNVTFWNATCTSDVNTTSTNNLEINAQPSISSVSTTGGAILNGKTVTFTTAWTDQNSSGTDSVTVHACKTDAFTTSCTGGAWGTSSAETDNSTQATYTIQTSDTAGTKYAYIYLIDDNSYASSSTKTSFVVSRPLSEEDENGVSQESSKGVPKGLIVISVIVIIFLIVMFIRKK